MIHYKDYDYSRIPVNDVIEKVEWTSTGNRDVIYSNIIFTFDCEVSSYYVDDYGTVSTFDYDEDAEYYKDLKKQSIMYIWMVGINLDVVYGRDYKEYQEFESKLRNKFLGITRIYYVHNLSYDFQFIQNGLGTEFEVFSRSQGRL